ncbi:MAG: hypothetical protein EB051_02595 [Chlamydiia bacterium]|nr:hypothetical protein [Chlamydiia bacterium]
MASLTGATAVNRLCILLDVDENLVKKGTTQWNSSLIERIKELIHYNGFNQVDVFCVTGRNPIELKQIFQMNNKELWLHHSLKNVKQKLEQDFFSCQVRVATQLDAYVMAVLKPESEQADFPVREIPEFSENHYVDFEADFLASKEPTTPGDSSIPQRSHGFRMEAVESFNERMNALFERTQYPTTGESFLDAFQTAVSQTGWAEKKTLVQLIVNSLPPSDKLTVIFADDRDENVQAVKDVLSTSKKVDAFASILVCQDQENIDFIPTQEIELTVNSSGDSSDLSIGKGWVEDVADLHRMSDHGAFRASHSSVAQQKKVNIGNVEVAQIPSTGQAEKNWVETLASVVGTLFQGALSFCSWLVNSLTTMFNRYTSS